MRTKCREVNIYLIVLFVLLTPSLLATESSGAPAGHPDIGFAESVWGSREDKVEVEPGDSNAPLSVTLSNAGLVTLSRIEGKLILPLGFRNPANPRSNIVVAHESGPVKATERFTLNYAVDVDLTTKPGEYPGVLALTWFRRGEKDSLSANLAVKFTLTGRSSLQVEMVNHVLKAGTVNQIELVVTNEGTATAGRLEMDLSLSKNSSLSILGDTHWSLGTIAPGEFTRISSDVYAPAVSGGKADSLILGMDYFDAYGQEKNSTRTLGITIVSEDDESIPLTLELSKLNLLPGEHEEIVLTLSNLGELPARDLTIKLLLPTSKPVPLSLVNSEGIWRFESLEPDNSTVVNLLLLADPKLAETLQPITFETKYRDPQQTLHTISRTFFIQIMAHDILRTALEVSLSRSELRAGSINQFDLIIANSGRLEARNLQVSISTPVSSSPSPLSILSDGNWLILSLEPGAIIEQPLEVFASGEAASSAGQLVVEIRFLDPVGNLHVITRNLGIRITLSEISEILLEASILDPILSPGSTNTLELLLKNVGKRSAFNVDVSLALPDQLSTDLALVSGDGHFGLSEIADGEEFILDIGLLVSSQASGRAFQLPLTIRYNDASGATRSVERSLGVTVASGITSKALLVELDPSLTVGTINDLAIRLINRGSGDLTNLSIRVTSSLSNISILGSDEFFITKMTTGAMKELIFRAFVPEDIANTAVQMNVHAVYTDEKGKIRSEIFESGISVIGLIKLSIIETSFGHMEGIPTLQGVLLNEGNDPALFTRIKVNNPSSLQSLVTDPFYLGDVSPNAPLPFSLLLKDLNSDGQDILPLVLVMTYQDSLRKDHEIEVPISVNISPPPLPREQESPPSPIIFLLPVAGALVVGAYVFRRRIRRLISVGQRT